MKVTIELTEIECCNCHTTFAMTRELYQSLLDTLPRRDFYCPLGHPQRFIGETDAQRLKRQLDAAKADATFYRGHMERAEGSLRATRGVVTKLRKRVVAGTCPFGCRRHFVDLERHVGTKHPGAVLEGEEAAPCTSTSTTTSR